MKRYIALMLLLTVSCQLLAERVDQQKAKKIAMTVVGNRELVLLPSDSFSNLYIFSGANSFAIVAANDCARPLLAYSLEFPIQTENMPENLRYVLQTWEDEIQYAVDMKLEPTEEIRREWELLSEGKRPEPKNRTEVAPLIKTHWDQTEPFNNLCPEGSSTGCVATAMAQIMRYWEWPDKGVGSHSYDHNTYGTLSADFGNTVYEWDYMDINVSWLSPEEQQLAVATLMYHCGVSVEMNYGPSGSGAGDHNAFLAFASYFDYDSSSLQNLRASDYDADSWVLLLKTELDNGRPVFYCGYSESSGHAFICDGYDVNDYFHFNIGWSGLGDGYYAYGAINLEGTSTGAFAYNSGNRIIAGIQAKERSVASPEDLTVSVSGRDLMLSWSPVPDAHHYKVFDNGNVVNNNVLGNSYTISSVPYGTHTCYVKAVDADDHCSLRSEEAVGEVLFEGPVPYHVTAEVQDNDVSLSWTAPANETAQLKYGDGTPYSYYGSSYSNGFYWGQRFTPEQLVPYAGMAVSSVDVNLRVLTDYTLYICREIGGEMEQMAAQNFTATSYGWNTIQLTSPVVIDYTHNLFVFVYNETDCSYVAAYILDDDIDVYNARLYSFDGIEWWPVNARMSWLIRTNITDGTYTYSIYRNEQAIATNVTGTSYVDTGLPDGYYQYSVRTNYYGGLSDPSDIAEAIVGSVGYVSASANPPESGNIIGCGYYATGNNATLSASPNVGYLFDHWTENGTQVSASDTYSFVVNGDHQLVAEFKVNDLTVVDLSVTEPTCNGGDDGLVTVVVSGGAAPFVFEFEGEVSPASGNSYTFHDVSAGSFVLKVMDDTGYEVVVDVEIGEPEALAPGEIKSGSETVGNGGTCSPILSVQDATSPQATLTYRWSQNGVILDNSNTAQYTPSNLLPGTYSFFREVMDPCTDWTPSSGTWIVYVSQNDVDENNISPLEVYPNPTLGKIHIVLSERAARCQVIDLMGNVLQEITPSDPAFDHDLSGLPSGMYLIKIIMADGKPTYEKVIKY